ncbi:MAG: signal recognition particle-docking protein FtsY [Planctomycetes bacterium]|nr:signal recognition particle-docking protein FtsY [Planctomycetota bacterium]
MIFARLRESLRNTREKLAGGLSRLFGLKRELDDAFLAELEAVLFAGDLGPAGRATIEQLRAEYRERKLKSSDDVRARLRALLRARLGATVPDLRRAASGPTVVLVVGVNGSGKTTSVAKLAKHCQRSGRTVMVVACDTFRAAAVEQLATWAERLDVPIVRKEAGADPAAVAFDGAEAALLQGIDVLIVDTAGRLHTRDDLMQELGKVRRVLDKKIPGAPHETLLVLDATTGQNAIRQAEVFTQVVPLTGVILAKLDGTAKGGAVVSIRERLGIPVRFAGVGEKPDDFEPFDPERFLDALLEDGGTAEQGDGAP